jgi:multicomponent Na+:H+ antiporter subunit B
MKHDESALLDKEPEHRRGVGLLLVAGLAVLFGAAIWGLPREHAGLPPVARQALTVAIPDWHTLEPVNEVVYGTRGFDTFGETFLLLAAVVGIGVITRGREPRRGFIGEEAAGAREQEEDDPKTTSNAERQMARHAEDEEQGRDRAPDTPDVEPLGTPGPEQARGMTVVVRGAVRVVAPVLAISGLYLVAWGYSPGGGFPGGAVLLGVLLFAYVAFGYRRIQAVVRPGVVEPIEMLGALAIIVIGVLGLILKGSFSANFLPLGRLGTIPSGGILQLFSGAELVEVATGLTLAVFGLLGMMHDWTDQDQPPGGDRTDSDHQAQYDGGNQDRPEQTVGRSR